MKLFITKRQTGRYCLFDMQVPTDFILDDKTTQAIKDAQQLLLKDKASCVIIKEGKISFTLKEKGIRPILYAYENGLFKDAIVVDKVIGKAAAMVMFLGEVFACFGAIVSKGAQDFLQSKAIFIKGEKIVPWIKNRTETGLCPMEETIASITSPTEAVIAIKAKLLQLSN